MKADVIRPLRKVGKAELTSQVIPNVQNSQLMEWFRRSACSDAVLRTKRTSHSLLENPSSWEWSLWPCVFALSMDKSYFGQTVPGCPHLVCAVLTGVTRAGSTRQGREAWADVRSQQQSCLCLVSNKLSLPPASWQASRPVLSPVPDIYIL